MSTDQPRITDFVTAESQTEEEDDDESADERPNWDPGVRARRCGNCGSHVPPQHARVLRGDDGVIHCCGECDSRQAACNGKAAGAEPTKIIIDQLHRGGF